MKYLSLILSVLLFNTYIYSQCIGPAGDCDGDGIADSIDTDDDNDGILDADENTCQTSDVSNTVGIGNDLVSGSTYTFNDVGITYTLTTSGITADRHVRGYTAGTPPAGNGPAIRISQLDGGSFTGTLSMAFSFPVSNVSFKLTDFDERESYEVKVYDNNGNIYQLTNNEVTVGSNITQANNTFTAGALSGINGDAVSSDPVGSVLFNISGYVSKIELVFTHIGPSTIRFTQANFCGTDTDKDGIPNSLDLDSDGDGCPDAIEGGANFTTNDLNANNSLAGAVSTDGVPTIAGSGQSAGSSANAATNACTPIAYPVTENVTGGPQLTNLNNIPLQGSDASNGASQGSWSGDSVIITILPTNDFILKYNGTVITAGQKIANYNPALLTIEPGPATANGTKTTSFEYAVINDQGFQSAPATYTVNFSQGLPVTFESITATLSDGNLLVNWITTSETNNHHYEVQASTDGIHFNTIGEVRSKATDGNSSTPINYSFSKSINQVFAGISIFAIMLLLAGKNNKRKRLFTMLVFAGMAVYAISCNKSNKEIGNTDEKIYVRLVQIDKDGKRTTSKIVQARPQQ